MFQQPLIQLWSSLKPLTQRIGAGLMACLLSITVWAGDAIPAIAQPLTPTPLVASLLHFSGSRPSNIGVHSGKLAPCPATPNCVSSQAQDESHAIAPLTTSDAPAAAFAHLKDVVQTLPRTQIITASDNYLYVEFTSALMGFVDDVEFYLAPGSDAIQVRSASRLGESDLGVNRQRIESIRSAL